MEFGYPILGFFVGAVVGMTGMGGGAIMTAALIGICNVPALTAVGTDLVYAGVTKLVGTSVHARNRNVDWRVAILLALGSLPATGITLYGLSQVGLGNPKLELWVTRFLAIVNLVAAVTIIWRRSFKIASGVERECAAARSALTLVVALRTIVLGMAIGAVVTISSVGAGAIGLAMPSSAVSIAACSGCCWSARYRGSISAAISPILCPSACCWRAWPSF